MAPSLTRGWVCNVLLLLGLANTVALGSESCGTQDHIFCPHFLDSPNLVGQVPVCISPRDRVVQWVPFPSPLTTRRAAVDIF
jgi:hypothetical protein